MGAFTDAELAYLQPGTRDNPRLARLATVGPDGRPHVTPVGMWHVTADGDAIEVTGHNMGKSKKFRDATRTGHVAIVVDDIDPNAPGFGARGVEIRGRAEPTTQPSPVIRIRPDRIVTWGLGDSTGPGARSVSQ
jgi:pyridoxamine 5'-phosphate oxidase family protein